MTRDRNSERGETHRKTHRSPLGANAFYFFEAGVGFWPKFLTYQFWDPTFFMSFPYICMLHSIKVEGGIQESTQPALQFSATVGICTYFVFSVPEHNFGHLRIAS